ncbi:MAG: hypothetical protein OEX04_20330 [Acidimicrobiia bacterium]|nr:hypothetical protein [Acidimicrobiia bacterium]
MSHPNDLRGAQVQALRTALRYGLLSVFVAASVGAAAVSVLDDRLGAISLGREALWWFPVVGSLLFLVPGVVVLLRSDWHPVGWLMVNLGFGFLFSFGPDALSISRLSAVEVWWLWLSGTSVSAVFWTVWTALILVFPDGLSSRARGHRRLARSVLGFDAVCIVLTVFRSTLAVDVNGGVPSPMPLAVVPTDLAELAAFLPNAVLLVAIVDFVFRYRRARDPVRSQYRWVVWAFLFEVAALLVAIVVSTVTNNEQHPLWLLAVLGYLLVPVSFMVAILRYRLYDIDRVVSRTVAYSLVVLTVGAVYAIPVLLLPRLLGESNDLVVAGSTLAAATVFNPARRRIQRIVDRRFNRARYDAERELDAFSVRIGNEVTLDAVRRTTEEALERTLEPARIGVWTRKSS